MGYTTDFSGRFELDRELDDDLYTFLCKFNDTRRMARKLPPEFGVEGEFYVAAGGHCGQDHSDDIIDYSIPPSTQPGLWCQWRPTDDRKGIEWDGGEKFYEYGAWLEYIIVNFLKPNGYILNGQVSWEGEDSSDKGYIFVVNNDINMTNGEPDMSISNE